MTAATGDISTVAGNGTAGYSGDTLAATNAELYYPEGVVVDGAGNVYIADLQNCLVRMVNTSGIITTVAGTTAGAGTGSNCGYSGDGGLATSAELQYPEGVAVDGAGNLYIADSPGYYFTGWTGSILTDLGSTTSASTTLTVSGAENLVAGFAAIPGFVVTTATDDSSNPSAANCPGASCSLRDALAAAAATGGGNITFSSTVLNAPTTITLGSSLTIPTLTTVTGPTSGSGATLKNMATVKAGGVEYTVFTVSSGVTGAVINNLVITNGETLSAGGIHNSGTLTVTGSTISGNGSKNLLK